MNIFFTSDTHYSHKNIIKYSHRPFETVEEMDEKLIENYNSVVSDNDLVYHIGDFAYGSGLKYPERFFDRLKGKKHLILGNHDNKKTEKLPWVSVNDMLEIYVGKQRIVLCHYAMRVWHHSYRGTWQLYGHSHGTLPEENVLAFDAGVDCWNYHPVSFEQVKKKMQWKKENPDYFSKLFKGNIPEISDRGNFVFNEIKKVNKDFY